MKFLAQFLSGLILISFSSCGNGRDDFDATGSFETDEVIVSSELSGKILRFDITEGQLVPKDSIIGTIDAVNISLQKEQVEANIAALSEKTFNVNPEVRMIEDQLKVQQSQLEKLLFEQRRIDNLVKQDAATGKQLDDINAEIDVARKRIKVTEQEIQVRRNATATQNRSILSEGEPLKKRVAQLEDQLSKANIINPVGGTVITKYAEAGEITSTGKALYKIADLSVLTLRAYVSGTQLSQIKLNQPVTVLVDDGKEKYRELPGTITWIADKAEFTPKTIQTKDERANLVYAVKIRVKNDGYLKIGMYGEVKFQESKK